MAEVYVIGRDSLPSPRTLRDGETLEVLLVALPGVSAQAELRYDINSPGCELTIRGVFLCSGNDRLSMNVLVRHNIAGSSSRQLYKGLADGSSKVDFDGLIYIAHGAGKTEAHQEVHSVLLSPSARVESKPQLEIYADDVICSHGCSSGFLDAEAAFYMRSRGIPEDEALRLQKIAFIAPALEGLPEELREEVMAAI